MVFDVVKNQNRSQMIDQICPRRPFGLVRRTLPRDGGMRPRAGRHAGLPLPRLHSDRLANELN